MTIKKPKTPVTKESIEKISRDLNIDGIHSVEATIHYDLPDEGLVMQTLLSLGYTIEYLNNSYGSRFCSFKNGKKRIKLFYRENHGK